MDAEDADSAEGPEAAERADGPERCRTPRPRPDIGSGIAAVRVPVGEALPGDPALALGGEERDPAVLTQIRHDYGLDQPLPVQYIGSR